MLPGVKTTLDVSMSMPQQIQSRPLDGEDFVNGTSVFISQNKNKSSEHLSRAFRDLFRQQHSLKQHICSICSMRQTRIKKTDYIADCKVRTYRLQCQVTLLMLYFLIKCPGLGSLTDTTCLTLSLFC